MTYGKKLLIGAFLIINSCFCFSQETWTLEQCINYALENNIQVKQQKLSTVSMQNTLQQSKANILPSINAEAEVDFDYGRSVDQYTNEFSTTKVYSNSVYVYSSMDLFTGFRKYNTIQRDSYNLMASLQDLEKMKNDISLNVATAYLQILFNEELLVVAKNQLEITKQQVDRTNKLVEAGSVAKGNLLEVQAQLATEEQQLIDTENQLFRRY